MRLKQQPGDFRVLEVLNEGATQGPGEHRVYRVTKTKLTTLEAVERIAREANVPKHSVEIAGLKDRQGVTVQYVSIAGGPRVGIQELDLHVEWVADAARPISSDSVRANSFDLVIRGLTLDDLNRFDSAIESVRRDGVPNYFDDQRFGALRHGQGFLVREMIDGEIESALMRCLLQPSPFDPPREAAFKGRLRRAWGDFEQCVSLCRGGKHISVFRHLASNPKDFAGAFRFVGSRIRLIHLYAYQSHLWNQSVSTFLRERVSPDDRALLSTDDGPLVAFTRLPEEARASVVGRTMPLLAPDVVLGDPEVKRVVSAVLAQEGLTLDRLAVPGVEGFAFKAEERAILVVPEHVRVREPVRDDLNPGLAKLRIRFELPRGSYATLVVKRLFARPVVESFGGDAADRSRSAEPRRPRPTTRQPARKPSQLRESGILPESILPKPPRLGGPRSGPPRGPRGGRPQRPPFRRGSGPPDRGRYPRGGSGGGGGRGGGGDRRGDRGDPPPERDSGPGPDAPR